MKRNLAIGSICLAGVFVLQAGFVVQGADITGTYSSPTTLVDGDTWTSGHVTINGVTVTVPTGATVTYNAASAGAARLYGTSPGTFLIDTGGTFKIATSGGDDNVPISGPVKILNEGTFDFASGAELYLNHSEAVFENTGTILKSVASLGSSGNPSYIFRSSVGSGEFFNNGGNIQVDAGTLEILGGSSTGGTFTTNGDGRLQLSDHWTGFEGTSSGKPVYINCSTSTASYKFVAAATTTVVDVDGQGLMWDGADIDTSGHVLQNDGLFTIGLATTEDLTGGGKFLNSASGTLDVQKGTVNLTGGTAFENEGEMTFTTTNTKTFQGAGTILNKSGATANWQAGIINLNAADVALKNEGAFNLTGGDTKTLSGTGAFENAAGATMNWNGGNLTLNAALLNATNGTTNGVINWNVGNLTLNSDLTNNGQFVYDAGNANIYGTGKFVNNGTFTHAGTEPDNLYGEANGGEFVNNGTFDFANEGDMRLGEGYTFTNNGTLKKTVGTGSESLFFEYASETSAGVGGTFDNQGAVEVLAGVIEFTSGNRSGTASLVITQYDTSTKSLTGGAWIVRDPDGAGGGLAKLDLIPANAGIQTIGSGAVVELSGADSLFPQLTGHLTGVAGTLTINNRTFAASAFGSGALTLTGGTIDGTGAVELPGNVSSTGASTLSVATLDLGGAARTFDVTSTLNVSSAVTNGGLTKTGDGTLTLSGANTFSGGTTVDAGTLQLDNSLALQNSTFDSQSGAVGTLSFGALTSATFGGLQGANDLALVNDSPAAVALTVGGNNASTTFSGSLSGTGGSLTKTGTGTLTLSGATANTYTGLTTVSGGVLVLSKASGVTAVPGDLAISNGAKVLFSASGVNEQIADGAAVTMSGANSGFNCTGFNSNFRDITETIGSLDVSGGVFHTGTAPWTVTGAASFTGGTGNTIFLGNSRSTSYFGSLSLTDMNAASSGNVANSFNLYGNESTQSSITVGSGGLTLNNSVIYLRNGSSTGAQGSRLVLNGDVTTTGTLASSISDDTASGVYGAIAVELSSTTSAVIRTFSVGAGGADLSIGVPVTNGASTSAGLTKTGAGTLTLSAASTYTGPTTVEAGTLTVNGSVASDVAVNGGWLKGGGTIGGVVIGPLGSISAGNSPGLLSVDGDYEQAGLMLAELAGTTQGLTYDSIDVSGAATFGPGAVIDVDLIGFDPLFGDVFDILTASEGIDADLNSLVFDYSDAATQYFLRAQIVSLGGTAEALRLTAVPEPSALILLALGAGLLAWPRRHRKQAV